MPRVALQFAYHGPSFDGYVRQPRPGMRTVEGAVLAELAAVGAIEDVDACGWRSGSRTDRGVSARENVAALEVRIPAERVAPALGGRVPGVWGLSSVAVDGAFDPRHAAWREYRYFLPRAWVPAGAEAADLEEALSVFQGTHDFSGFARLEAGRTPQRTVDAVRVTVDTEADAWVVAVRGRSFLWNQVRRMVGAGLAVVRGHAQRAEVEEALREPGGARDLGLAPAGPLVLWQVAYPRLEWPLVRGHRERVQETLEEARSGAAVQLRLVQSLLDRVQRDERRTP